jgi:hypothetical protein
VIVGLDNELLTEASQQAVLRASRDGVAKAAGAKQGLGALGRGAGAAREMIVLRACTLGEAPTGIPRPGYASFPAPPPLPKGAAGPMGQTPREAGLGVCCPPSPPNTNRHRPAPITVTAVIGAGPRRC